MNEFLEETNLLLNCIEWNTKEHWANYYKDVPIDCIYDDLVIDINEIKRLQEKNEQLQNDLDAANSRTKELSGRIIKAIEYIQEHTELVPFNEDDEGGGLLLCDYDVANVLEILKGEPNNENRS